MAISEEIYTHEYLWRSSTALLAQAKREKSADDDRSHYILIPALLITFMAYEAFVNFLGYVLAPELWADERTSFRGKGLEGRLGAVIERLPGYKWDKGANPYQAIKRLEQYRDMVAHGKVIASEYTTPQKIDGTHYRYQHPWDEFLTIEALETARERISEFSESLLEAARLVSDEPHLIFKAYDGSLARGHGWAVRD